MTKQGSLSLVAKRVGNAVKKMAGAGKSWHTPFMAAASHAVSQRITSVDFVLDIRDARNVSCLGGCLLLPLPVAL